MGMRLSKNVDVWKFVVPIAFVCIFVSELFIVGMYAIAGPEAFRFRNILIMGLVVPTLISVPITLWVARLNLKLHRAHSKLQVLADTDALTDLPNRRQFFNAAQPLLDRCAASDQQATLLIIDADHFKDLNDSYGHAAGDQALVVIADVLRETTRHSDLLSRVGGEEFAVLLPQTTAIQSHRLAERIVTNVTASPVTMEGAIIEFSVSCGIADTAVSFDLATLFTAADDAMYQAKKEGRNRVFTQTATAA